MRAGKQPTPHLHVAGGNSAFAGVNLSDPRFAELVTSHHFALDPTDPRFK